MPNSTPGRVSALLAQITSHCPDMRVEKATLNLEGQYNDVLIVNDSMVFRFARVPTAIETLKTELLVLRSLQGRVPLAVPSPLHHNLETDVIGEAFVGYQMIPGRPLWRDAFAAIEDQHALDRMAAQLSGFLRALHVTVADEIGLVDLPRYETQEHWESMYARIERDLFPLIRPDARDQIAALFESCVHLDGPRPAPKPSLRHGDFGTGNIIYDPGRLSINGIIDFGHVGIGDPACDFAGLLSSYGEAFYARCVETYPAMATSIDRTRFCLGTFALEEALFGLDNGDEAAFRAGIAAYV